MRNFATSPCRLASQTPFLGRGRVTRSSIANDLLITTTGVVASGSFVLSSLQLFNAVAQLPEQDSTSINLGDEDDTFVWSVATVLSLIPIFNFTAWAMAAQSTDATRRFYTLSAVYAPSAVIPFLTGMVPLGSVLLYTLCLLHVQVELTAATNPQAAARVLEALPGQGRQLIAAGDQAARTIAAFMEALDYTIEEKLSSSSTKLPLREQRMFDKDMQTSQELRRLEAKEWDDKLQNRGKHDKQ
eukprot:jgi/Ulvmu1/4861/UM020_0147.1